MGRRKAYDRDEVLNKAMELFWRLGFEGAHLSQLVEVTGLNRFSLYKEFGGKEGLFEEALDLYLKSAREAYDKHLDREPYGANNIRTYFSAINYQPDYHGCFLINTLMEKAIVSDKAFDMANSVLVAAEKLYRKNLKAAKDRGELAASADLKDLAKLLISFDQGLAIYGIARPNNREKNRIVKTLLEQLFETDAA